MAKHIRLAREVAKELLKVAEIYGLSVRELVESFDEPRSVLYKVLRKHHLEKEECSEDVIELSESIGSGEAKTIFGFAPTAVLRYLGRDAWLFKEARLVMDRLEIDVADATIRAQLYAGKKGTRGPPAKLNDDQIEELYLILEGG